MRVALLSDLHANWQALQACLAHARAQGVDQWAVLGDLVGYGGDPVRVLDAVMDLQAQGAWVLRGNHDEMALAPPADDGSSGASSAPWTHAQLQDAHRAFLQGLPLTHRHEHLLLVHASAQDPARWRYVDSARAAQACLDAVPEGCRQVMVGHVHEQTLYYQGAGAGLMPFSPRPGAAVPLPRHRPWVATVGSVGQPRDRDPRAMYALYDLARGQLVFHRVAYDHAQAAASIRRAGLPDLFASRLEQGR